MSISAVQPAPAWSRAAVREVWAVAWPTVVTMTSYTLMQFVDKLMVAQVGPLEVAAQGNGGIWAFNAIAIAMGVLTVINTFVAQNLGAGTPERGPKYAWAGLWLSLVVWIAFLVPWAVALPSLFSLMGHGERLQRLESVYGRILLAGSVVLLSNKAMSHYFFGMHRPRVIAFAAISGNIVNFLGNYALVFGERGLPQLDLPFVGTVSIPGVPGAPALGVAGSAISTVIGTGFELLIPLAVFLGRRMNALYGTRSAWRFDAGPIRDLVRLGWPAAVQWGGEIVCWSIFMSVLCGRFGNDHMTAGWATLSYMHLSFMPAVGFSVAVSALVGRYIGAGQPDTAAARANLGLALAMAYMTVCAVVMIVFRRPLIGAFVSGHGADAAQAAAIVAIGSRLMICAALFQTADAVGVVSSGALRGAGDTVWPGVATFVLSWVFIVGGGWLLVTFAPQLESLGPWIAAAVYIVILGAALWTRWRSGKWRAIKLVEWLRAPAAAPVVIGPPATAGDEAVEDLAADVASEVATRWQAE
ncbi:MAG: MATE family efflux transporter [Phycisphaerales bacterium]